MDEQHLPAARPACDDVPSNTWDKINHAVAAFEDAWQAGQRPVIEDHLPTVSAARLPVLVELVHADLERRVKSGLTVRVEDYLQRFPELAATDRLVMDLIVAEYRHWRNLGQTPQLDDYLQRFPSYHSQLVDQLANTAEETDLTPEPAAVRRDDLPAQLGRYRIVQEIARGGMGQIVYVQDEDFQRPLAMKVLLGSGLRQPGLAARFLREARLTGQLQHPGVPPVQEFGTLPDGRPYFIMKWIKGQSLAALLRARQTCTEDLPRFLNVFEQVCQTLAYAHSHGILHRDLKPANIMVGEFGEVQVMDWGLAKLLPGEDRGSKIEDRGSRIEDRGSKMEKGNNAPLDPRSSILDPRSSILDPRSSILDPGSAPPTLPGDVMGTPAYMAPEQARGEIDRLDARCDVFGLGAILCELLTGQPPFTAGTRENLRLAQQGDLSEAFVRLDRCGADVELIELARTCLAPLPHQRPANAGAVAAAVAQYQADLQQRLKQAEIDQAAAQAQAQAERRRHEAELARVDAERRRQRVTRALAALLALFAVLASAAGAWYFWDQGQRQLEQAEREKEQARRDVQQARQQAREAARKDFVEQEAGKALAEDVRLRHELMQQLTDPRKVPVLLSDLGRWQTRLDRRFAILKGAGQLIDSNPELVTAGLKQQVRTQQVQLQSDQKDWQLAQELDNIRLRSAGLHAGKFVEAGAVAAAYAELFARRQWAVLHADPAAVAAHHGQSPLRLVLAAALDDWASAAADKETRQQLLAISRRLDPGPWRDQVRAAVASQERGKLQLLARQGNLQEQSPQLILLLAFHLPGPEDSVQLLRAALVHHPDDFWLHVYLGAALKDPVDRVSCFRTALALRPRSAPIYLSLGVALNDHGDLPEAIQHFQKAIALDPQFAWAHYNLGRALAARKDLPGAIQHYQQAIALDPNYAQAHNNLGKALFDQKNLAGAVTHFRKAIALNPSYALAHFNLGVALGARRHLPAAITSFQKVIALQPNHVLAHLYLGEAQFDQQDLSGAIVHFQKAVELAPTNAQVHFHLGYAWKARGDLPAAIASYREAIALDPQFARAHYNLAKALKAQKDLAGAIQHYQQTIALDPNHADAHYNLALALDDRRDPAGAIQHYQQAIALNPNHACAHCNLGIALRDQGRFAEALKELQVGDALGRKDPGWQYPSGQWLKDCEQLLALDQKLTAVLRCQAQPQNAAEQLTLAHLCRMYRKQYAAAARLYAAAFAAAPQLAQDLTRGWRYHAARAALLAAAGQGQEAAQLQAKEKTQLRRQALDWLQADLAQWQQQSQSQQPAPLLQLTGRLSDWQSNQDLAGVREEKELASLSEDEQQNWHRLWSDVAKLHKQVEGCFTAVESKSGVLTARERQQTSTVKLQAGVAYVIDLQSQQFDPLLRLEDDRGQLLAASTAGNAAKAGLLFTPTQDSAYRLVVTSFQQRGLGPYVLTVRRFTRRPSPRPTS